MYQKNSLQYYSEDDPKSYGKNGGAEREISRNV